MEQINDAMNMVALMPRPAFCVRDNQIVTVNSGAAGCLIEPGTDVMSLLQTGRDEYSEFTDGCLYLNLSVSGQIFGASVTRMQDFDVFCMEPKGDSPELQAMSLSARELREPLAGIMTTAHQLFPEIQAIDNSRISDQISRLQRGLYQMLRIIGNMSDAARYTAADTYRQAILNISAVLNEILGKAASLIEHTGVSLEYEGCPNAIYTLADSEMLERAVMNMISNAVKFTPAGGTVRARLTQRGKKLYLSIQDNGCGINPALRGNIYTRYTRTPGVEDGRYGIGLGMVLIRSTAAAHGGTVLVDQVQGVGTRVTMSIAIRQGERGQLKSPVLHVDYAGGHDHGMIEFSDILPAEMYHPKNTN